MGKDKQVIDKLSKTKYKEKYGFKDNVNYNIKFPKGLSKEIVSRISKIKKEPKWLLDLRLKAYKHFQKREMPKWGADLSELDFDNIRYFASVGKQAKNWKEVPENIKDTFEKLKIPEFEIKFLAGTATQYESEIVYNKLKKEWEDLGIIFGDIHFGLEKYPDLFREYFGKLIPYTDNKFASLNTAVFSGGTFIYVPKGVKVKRPLQTYFRINLENMGQFERTLIIADEGSSLHYIEGCTAPIYRKDSLHSAVVEIFALKGAKVRYTTIQNWSNNVYNLVTKRAMAYQDSKVTWVDCNLGSKITMKYPAVILKESGASGEVLSIAMALKNQLQDTGAKMIHLASNTSSLITSKSICKDGGRTTYRGLVKMIKGIKNVKSKVVCDALIFDDKSRTDTYPTNEINTKDCKLEHEASVSKLSKLKLQYLMSRAISEEDASKLIIAGFLDPISKHLPMEYASELNALLDLTMEDSVG